MFGEAREVTFALYQSISITNWEGGREGGRLRVWGGGGGGVRVGGEVWVWGGG